jgi:hypothetical protein
LAQLGVAVTGTKLDLASKTVHIEGVTLSGFQAGATIISDRDSAAVATETKAEAPAPVAQPLPSSQETGTFFVTVGPVVFENAALRFVDESLDPHVITAIEEFNGSIKGLSSDLNTTATVDFKGKVDGLAPFSVSGQINPLTTNLFVDLAISLHDSNLTPGAPYSAKYAGYQLEKGKLTLDLHYLVTQRELKAENVIRVDQLRLGARTNSPDAVKLPVKLAIALLQDRNGVIALDVPVSGRLDDPKFKLGPIILQVFMNLITKAVTKPFALLGALFGGGEELSFIEFKLGASDFSDSEVKKLDSLATALYERPGLSLEIAGAIDHVHDRKALALAKLRQQLASPQPKRAVVAEKAEATSALVQLRPDDYERLVGEAYQEALRRGAVKAPTPTGTGTAHYLRTNIKNAFVLAPRDAASLTVAQSAGQESKTRPPQITKALDEITLAEMEDALAQTIQISENEFKDLMVARAKRVQDYLLQTGKVTADRLFIIAPKPVDSSYQGQHRVNLSLQ